MSKITTKWITDDAVTKTKINADVAGNGIEQAAGGELQIKPDATTGGNVANVASVTANGLGVNIDNTTIKVVGGQLVASGCTEKVEMHLLTAGEKTNGFFALAATPADKTAVRCDVVGGPMQINKQATGIGALTPDFDILGTPAANFHFWNVTATGLSQELDTGDTVIVRYEV